MTIVKLIYYRTLSARLTRPNGLRSGKLVLTPEVVSDEAKPVYPAYRQAGCRQAIYTDVTTGDMIYEPRINGKRQKK